MYFLELLVSIFCITLYIEQTNGSQSNDPTLLPGHLKPLGTGRPISKVEVFDGFPEPLEFFNKYVNSKTKKAVLFKGGAKLSPAFQLWSDEYLKNHPESEQMEFDMEIGKKEDRKGNMEKRTVKKFIESYHIEDIYAVTDVPKQLKHQFLLPPPIRCNNIKDKLSMMLMWFSSGGTKSVLHHDSFENINCLFRGSKRLLIAEYPKYVKQVVIDRPNGYSSVDIDKVDFTKYPGLTEVDYWEANMEQGDCIYIPFNWFHQVNSFANENKTNIAVNVWWYKNDSFVPEDCTLKPEEATLDKFNFNDAEEKYSDAGSSSDADPSGIFYGYFRQKNVAEIPYEEFLSDIQNKDNMLSDLGISEIPSNKRREKFAKMFYEALDVDDNGVVDFNDYNSEDDEKLRQSQRKIRIVLKQVDRYFEWLEKQGDAKQPKNEDNAPSNAKEEL